MGTSQSNVTGPDLTLGIAATELPEGKMLAGHVGSENVLLARSSGAVFAIGATCTHYGGPLAEGLLVGETVRCPWHHACFSLRTGEALHAPAFAAVRPWQVEERDGRIVVRAEKPSQVAAEAPRPARSASSSPQRIVIVGGGAAGFAAAEMLRRSGYGASLAMLSSDDAPPVDRPNLSKDYLAGSAPEDWVPLRPDGFYGENGIDLRLGSEVASIDVGAHEVVLSGGERIAYDRLLLATGAEPHRLSIPGADASQVHTLRSLADCRAIIAQAATAKRAVVLGASFIGLEVAASLRSRGLEVHVVAPEQRPMQRVLGQQIAELVKALHDAHGVTFHLGDTAAAIEGKHVRLKSGSALEADLVVAGIGVRPRTQLAEAAGVAVDQGICVDEYLQTSSPDIYAAGDIARWPDPGSGERIRVEHWVVAERQGQTAARNMLGARERFTAVPFFWSQHYDAVISYVGHAASWSEVALEGDVAAMDFVLRYKREGRVVAIASMNRDVESLTAEVMMEEGRS